MENTPVLPEGYAAIERMDWREDQRASLLVNGSGLLLAMLLIMAGETQVSLSTLFDASGGWGVCAGKLLVLAAGLIGGWLLRQRIRGACMKRFSGQKVRCGFAGLRAYAGCQTYFNKRSYMLLILAPVLVWGVGIFVGSLVVPASWFWCLYAAQVHNVAGAAGDFYILYMVSRLPEEILVQDTGVAITVYAPG